MTRLIAGNARGLTIPLYSTPSKPHSEVPVMPFAFKKSRPAALLAAVALPSILFTACGGGGGKTVEADAWVETVCDAAKDFQKSTDKAAEKFFDIDTSDTAKAKKTAIQLVDDNKEAAEEFRKEFEKAGKPDLKSGDAVVKAFEAQFKENDKQIADLKKKMEAINVKEDFESQFLAIAEDAPDSEFRSKLEEVAEDEDDAQEIIDLIDEDADCADVIFDDESVSEPSTSPTPSKTTPAAGKTPAAAPKTTNEKWVAGICTSFVNWVGDIEKANTTLQTNLGKFDASKNSPGDLKSELVTFLKAGQTETKNLKKEIDALKTPDVKDGAKIHQVFAKAATDLVKVFDDAVVDAQKINASSFATVAADIDGFETKILNSFDEVSTAFDELDSYNAPEIEKAFESRPECIDLN